jgi:hypothetical protein
MKKKEVIVTPETQEKFKNAIRFFNSRTFARSGHVAPYYYAIVGCGILKEPSNHFVKGINDIWLYVVNINREGTDIDEVVNFDMTIAELLLFKKAIDDAIDIYKNDLKRKVPDNVVEGLKEQKKKINGNVFYKFEK